MIVLLTKSDHPVSKWVRFGIQHDSSHVLILDLDYERVLEAKGSASKTIMDNLGLGWLTKNKKSGVMYSSIESVINSSTEIRAVWLAHANIERAREHVGKEFDLLSIFAQFFRLNLDDADLIYCAELIGHALHPCYDWIIQTTHPREIDIISEPVPHVYHDRVKALIPGVKLTHWKDSLYGSASPTL